MGVLELDQEDADTAPPEALIPEAREIQRRRRRRGLAALLTRRSTAP